MEPLPWGRSAGCGFVSGPCSAWQQPRYLCSSHGDEACSYDRRSLAYCDLHTFESPLPAYERYVGDAYHGGFSSLLDHCPVYRPYSNGDCTNTNAWSAVVPTGGQERCEHCRCFESTTNSFRSRPG